MQCRDYVAATLKLGLALNFNMHLKEQCHALRCGTDVEEGKKVAPDFPAHFLSAWDDVTVAARKFVIYQAKVRDFGSHATMFNFSPCALVAPGQDPYRLGIQLLE